MLVGDVIQAMREATTDQPGTLPVPTASAAVIASAFSTLTAGTYRCIVTQINSWGQTLGAAEISSLVVGPAQGIQVTSTLLPGATTVRAYLTLPGGIAGSECQFVESIISPFTISADPTNAGQPPARNTAYNPDMDGDSFSAGTVFRWLNDALKLASQICGGLIDYSGVGSVSGQPMYVVNGQWKSIADVWYDGYPLAPDKAGNFFRRNAITASVLSMVATTLLTDRMMLEVWPQPSRTAASTILASPLSAAATTVALVNAGSFLLTNGFVQVENEIIAYNGRSGNTLLNLIRGLSGTPAVAHGQQTPANELNLFFRGWRNYAPTYAPGNSQSVIPVPVGWETMLPIYGLARVKLSEQNVSEYTALKKDFETSLMAWMKTNKVTTGPRQIGEASNNLEVIPSLGGGWIVP